jgi:hypothetical protein
MKTARAFTLLVIALLVGFLAARWSQAKPVGGTSDQRDINIAELVSLENYLQDSKQTNALKQLNDILADNRAWHDSADLAVTVSILQGLREGQTNQVLKFLENHLVTEICVFGSEYRALPLSLQKQMNLKSLQRARDYCGKFPFKNSGRYYDTDVTNAFKILEQ